MSEAKSTKEIDWNDPLVQSMESDSFFVPKDSNIEKEVMTRQGFNLQGESAKLIEEEVQREKVVAEQDAEKEPTKVSGKRKKSLARRKEASKK
ncbi:hypothetical protein Tco_1191095 [Tanacetum coccineum]